MTTKLDSRRALRVVVCGTTFGRVYLEALRRAAPRFTLAAIYGRGSEHSRACARAHGVPLVTDLGDLPRDLDMACVVVRAGVVGGRGSELAQALMERGLHVLQEQPVHHDEVVQCLRVARKAGVFYQLNPFYRHVGPVHDFLRAAAALRRQTALRYVEATCAVQVLYPLIDMLAQALGGVRPWSLSSPLTAPQAARATFPFTTLEAVVAGVPVTLRVQNELDPSDPDNHAYCLQKMTLGSEAGTLTLTDTHGPVLWHPRMHVPRASDGVHVLDGAKANLRLPSVSTIGSAAGRPFGEVLSSAWPEAVERALDGFAQAIDEGADALSSGQYALTVCKLWQDVASTLDRPRLVHHDAAPQPLAVQHLVPAHEAPPEDEAPQTELRSMPRTLRSTPANENRGAWLRTYRKVASPRVRLVCFPHAGGSASAFRDWPALLPSDLELLAVQYPGREERLEEPLIGEMPALVDEALAALRGALDRPFAFFGHSMGASVAYELAGRLAELGLATPAHLFVSGQCAPEDHQPGDVHQRDDAGLCAELVRVGGAQPLLDEPELRALLLPIVRNDFRLIETYAPRRFQLDVPVRAYGGDSDPDVGASGLSRWSRVTRGTFGLRMFAGGHFYLSSRRSELVADVAATLTSSSHHGGTDDGSIRAVGRVL